MTPKPKKEKWVEEVKEFFKNRYAAQAFVLNLTRTQIKKAQKEILEKVELNKKELTDEDRDEPNESDLITFGYNQAVADLLALKEKLKKEI